MSHPYHDLSLAPSQLDPLSARERVAQAIRLGWDVVALAHQAAARLGDADK